MSAYANSANEGHVRQTSDLRATESSHNIGKHTDSASHLYLVAAELDFRSGTLEYGMHCSFKSGKVALELNFIRQPPSCPQITRPLGYHHHFYLSLESKQTRLLCRSQLEGQMLRGNAYHLGFTRLRFSRRHKVGLPPESAIFMFRRSPSIGTELKSIVFYIG